MTEAEWLAAGDVADMVRHLAGHPSGRKRRLLACAAATRAWPSRAGRAAVAVAERFADGLATVVELAEAEWRAEVDRLLVEARLTVEDRLAGTGHAYPVTSYDRERHLREVRAATLVEWAVAAQSPLFRHVRDGDVSSDLLHCIFGNPFRPVTFAPAWLTPTAVALADGVYHDRAFDRLPILADALQDAGCEDADVLAHCRGGGPRVRGCWVVDAILNKSWLHPGG